MATYNVPSNWTLTQIVNRVVSPVIDRAMIDAGATLCNEVLVLIHIPGPPRSKPMNPPHIDTAKLFGSIAYQYDRKNVRTVVVADTDYAQKLEFGGWTGRPNRWQAPRPFMRRSLYKFATVRNVGICFRNALDPTYIVDLSMMRNDIV